MRHSGTTEGFWCGMSGRIRQVVDQADVHLVICKSYYIFLVYDLARQTLTLTLTNISCLLYTVRAGECQVVVEASVQFDNTRQCSQTSWSFLDCQQNLQSIQRGSTPGRSVHDGAALLDSVQLTVGRVGPYWPWHMSASRPGHQTSPTDHCGQVSCFCQGFQRPEAASRIRGCHT